MKYRSFQKVKHSKINFRYTMTFSQCVHGIYDVKTEAVYRKCSQNASFEENPESIYYMNLYLLYHLRTEYRIKI